MELKDFLSNYEKYLNKEAVKEDTKSRKEYFDNLKYDYEPLDIAFDEDDDDELSMMPTYPLKGAFLQTFDEGKNEDIEVIYHGRNPITGGHIISDLKDYERKEITSSDLGDYYIAQQGSGDKEWYDQRNYQATLREMEAMGFKEGGKVNYAYVNFSDDRKGKEHIFNSTWDKRIYSDPKKELNNWLKEYENEEGISIIEKGVVLNDGSIVDAYGSGGLIYIDTEYDLESAEKRVEKLKKSGKYRRVQKRKNVYPTQTPTGKRSKRGSAGTFYRIFAQPIDMAKKKKSLEALKKKYKLEEGGGIVDGYKLYDPILQGYEGEEFALDYARGLDWGSSEYQMVDSLPTYKRYIDTINGIDVYYDDGADYYFFVDADETYAKGGNIIEIQNRAGSIWDNDYRDTIDQEDMSSEQFDNYYELATIDAIKELVNEKKLPIGYTISDYKVEKGGSTYAEGGGVKKKRKEVPNITYTATIQVVDAKGKEQPTAIPTLEMTLSSDKSVAEVKDIFKESIEQSAGFKKGNQVEITDFYLGGMETPEEERVYFDFKEEEEEAENFEPRVKRSGKWDESYSTLCDELATYQMGGEIS